MRCIVLVLLCAAGAQSQATILIASHLEALWSDGQALLVQTDRRIHRMLPDPNGMPQATSAAGTEIPSSASFFDVRDGRSLWVGDRVWGDAVAGDEDLGGDGPFLRREVGGSPVRLPLLLGGGGFVSPGRPWFLCRWPGGSEVDRLVVPLHGALELGWGAGDQLEVDIVIPQMLPRRSAGGLDLVVGIGARWTRHRRGARPAALDAPPVDGEDGILDFPFSVPPVCADLDGDGDDDLVVIDPSAGAVAVYTDLDASAPAPARVLLVDGLCLAAWVGDYDMDGRVDLVLLRARKPGLAGQLKVLQRGLLSAEALLYPGAADGTLPASPGSRRKLDVEIRIGIRNEAREAEFTSMCVPRPGPVLLVGRGDGTLARVPFGDGEAIPVGLIPEGAAVDAFRVVTCGGGVAFGWQSSGSARVVWLKDA